MSKSITLKTHKFLTALGLHPVGGALKEDQMQINAAALRKSVRKMGWLTFVHVPKSQVVNVCLNNEF